MMTLTQALTQAEKDGVAIAHFNFSELTTLQACWQAVLELSKAAGRPIPVIFGVSEGEAKAVGAREAVRMISSLRAEHNHPVFINADHHKSLEACTAAIDAGFDSVIIDAADKSFDENVRITKVVAEYARASSNKQVLIEGEIGYIGSGSQLLDALPAGAVLTEDKLPTVEQVASFVQQTGINLLAPAVGNIHGMLKNAPNPHLFIEKIKEYRTAAGVPLVLHGGSGTPDEDFVQAVKAGIRIVHISTELRRAWRAGIESALNTHPNEVAPYKLLESAHAGIKDVAMNRLRLFTQL